MSRRKRGRVLKGVWRADRDGRIRYRGRVRRGQQERAVIDDLDLKTALDELLSGREMLRVAHGIEDRHSRREAIKTALGKIALSTRMADEVVMRRGGICGDIFDEDSGNAWG